MIISKENLGVLLFIAKLYKDSRAMTIEDEKSLREIILSKSKHGYPDF